MTNYVFEARTWETIIKCQTEYGFLLIKFNIDLLTEWSINRINSVDYLINNIMGAKLVKKSEKTEHTMSKILDAAMNEFGKNGYSGGTINTICNAGINKGLLYHNFKGKDDIYLTCLKQSCQRLLDYITQQGGTENLEGYFSARLSFFNNCPNEAHIFFEALLAPPPDLADETGQILSAFNALNERMYECTLDSIILRDEVSRNDAVSYFHMMQLMLNGYFSSPAFQKTDLSEKLKMHEMIVPKLLDYMLYGIAKGEN